MNSALRCTVCDPSEYVFVSTRSVRVVLVATQQISKMKSSKNLTVVAERSTVGPPA